MCLLKKIKSSFEILWTNTTLKGAIFLFCIYVNYSDIDEELEIITEEEYTKTITEAVNNIYEKFFEKLK